MCRDRSARNLRAWRYQQGRRLWTQVRWSRESQSGNVVDAEIHDTLGEQATMHLSILLLHRPHYLIPCCRHCSLSRVGALGLVMPLKYGLFITVFSGYNHRISSLEVITIAQ